MQQVQSVNLFCHGRVLAGDTLQFHLEQRELVNHLSVAALQHAQLVTKITSRVLALD